MKLAAFQFRHSTHSISDSHRFYRRHLRGFLRWHRTRAVWIKGGVVKRPAYLVFDASLTDKVKRMLLDVLRDGGSFEVRTVNPLIVLQEVLDLNRRTHGYLRIAGAEIGDPDEMFCPLERYRQVSVREVCISGRPCFYWSRYRCIYPKRWKPKKKEEDPIIAFPILRRALNGR